MIKKILLGLLLLLVVGFAAIKFMMRDVTVNMPMAQLLYTHTGHKPDQQQSQRMQVADGYQAQVWLDNLPGVRVLEVTPQGNLLASQPSKGKVVAILIGDKGEVLVVQDLLTGLDRPYGLALHNGDLYVAEGTQVSRVAFSESNQQLQVLGEREVIITGLPNGGNHWTRTIAFGPDERLYITAGSSCNVCIETHPQRAAMMVANADGSDLSIYATGLRNTEGFDWRPTNGELFGVDNGRDLLGDDFPPCELNHIVKGGFYGWPFANGNNVPDPDLGEGHAEEIAKALPPAYEFPAHVAPLSITFLPPQLEQDAALVAFHGSWNRSKKSGYKVVKLVWADDGIHMQDFMTGFEENEDVIGRPVDTALGKYGSIYVSDDFAGVIWRLHQ